MIDAGLLASAATFAVAAGSPGPATLAVSGSAMARGAAQGLAMAAGLSLGLAFWGVLAGLGFGALVAQSAAALTLLKLLGGAYLLYLSWVTARSALGPGVATPAEAAGGFRRGLLLNLSNPKAVLAWIAALALGSAPGAATWTAVALCTLIGAALYLVYALVFSRAPVMAFYGRARSRIEAFFAAFFALAGARLLFWRAAMTD